MNQTPVEAIFSVLNDSANILKNELDCSFLEALAETGENIFHDTVLQEEISEVAKKRLDKTYQTLPKMATNEDFRKAFQLACLKGMKENVQPNHQMTPDSIGIFLSFLIKKLHHHYSHLSILDPAVGTGNLLLTIINQLEGLHIEATGIEVDDILLQLAYVNANMQQHAVQFFNQDSLEPLFVDPVDIVICDLPIGYYPNDQRAKDYFLSSEEGHSYAHHLFIEQSTRHTKEGGYLFFVIPNNLFESSEAKKLHVYLKDHLHIQAVIQLPESMFKSKQSAKSLFVLQKQGKNVKAPKEVLLINMPQLTNKQAVHNIMLKIDQWIRENK
ncbi:class I SAM-dependent methyltransferase [Bacillus kwashiorkori]|uniref:class I SAM-dependent methyltransferase n=1 Tax=Bacillus kwashiorkori TaxID=1522318 RepID=UPI000785C95F|nr:class I SAM-dependent methyltransferase [Bacillus kwashiorkori]